MATEFILQRPDFRTFDPPDRIPPQLRAKYGLGLAYPPTAIRGDHWAIATGQALIKQAIYIILATPLGTRLLRPDFGSMLPFLIGNPIGVTLFDDLVFYTRESLTKWEPRITIQDVTLDEAATGNNVVIETISYVIKGIGTRDELQFPIDLNSPVPFAAAREFFLDGKQVF